MDARLRPYAERSVPRYTSYPTAPHFHAGVDPEAYAGWLQALDPAAPISLYLHVPFCRELCWYCGCNMKLASRPEPVARYAEALRAEIALLADHLPDRMTVSHLAWGGGTPTALEPLDLAAVMATVRERFAIASGAELAIECDPRTLTAEMAEMIGGLGFNRASFGVQEFDPEVQRAINRIQPPEMVRAASERLRGVGIESVNFDLIYGLPHQTAASLANTVRLCAEMAPDRLALFGYAHVPWMAKKQRMIDEAALPGAAERLAQAEVAAEAILAANYQAIGLDHFALPDDELAVAARTGTLKRNFQGYTTDAADTLLGVGVSAIGRTPHGFVQNLVETGAWARAVEAGVLPIAKGYALAGEDALRGAAIEAVMCGRSVDLDALGAAYGAAPDWYSDAADALTALAADDIVAFDGSTLAVTEAGRPFVRVAAAAFDTHLQKRSARHSVAV